MVGEGKTRLSNHLKVFINRFKVTCEPAHCLKKKAKKKTWYITKFRLQTRTPYPSYYQEVIMLTKWLIRVHLNRSYSHLKRNNFKEKCYPKKKQERTKLNQALILNIQRNISSSILVFKSCKFFLFFNFKVSH